MKKIIAYRALNEDYTDKVKGIKLTPETVISTSGFSTETFPIMLLSTYRFFGSKEKIVTIGMVGDSIVEDAFTGICHSNKVQVIKEIDSFDLVQEEILRASLDDNMPIKKTAHSKGHAFEKIPITRVDSSVASTGCDLSTITICRNAAISCNLLENTYHCIIRHNFISSSPSI